MIGIDRGGEMALIMTFYNMKRAINIMGMEKTVASTQDLEARLQEGYHEQAKTSYFKADMPTV